MKLYFRLLGLIGFPFVFAFLILLLLVAEALEKLWPILRDSWKEAREICDLSEVISNG